MPRPRFVPAAFAVPVVLLMSSLASAGAPIPDPTPSACGASFGCAQGFECAQVGTSCLNDCDATKQACSSICRPTPTYGCVPAHCQADAECAPGMVCHAWAEPCPVTCECPPGAMGCDCVSGCGATAVSICTPRYDLPCQAAADCGAGFTCEETRSCGCAAGTGAAPAPAFGGTASMATAGSASIPLPAAGAAAGGASSGGATGDPLRPDCMCPPSGPKQCVVQDIMCATDAQCPAGWSCGVTPSENVAAPSCSPGISCPMTPAPAPNAFWCRPPFYGAQSSGELQTPSPGVGTVGPTVGGPGTVGTGTGTGTNPGNPGMAGATNSDAHDVAACAMGRAPASSAAFAFLIMLGGLCGLKRRRA